MLVSLKQNYYTKKGGDKVDLNTSNEKNLAFILSRMDNQLGVANKSLFNPKDYDLTKYDDIIQMYELVTNQATLSPLETQAFLEELKRVRK